MARILVLDDEKDACRLMQRVLSAMGHQVLVFTGSAEARAWLEDNEPDLALLDIKLREDNGLSVLRLLRSRWPAAKVIMITGFPSAETAREATRLGIEDYLVKPVEIEDLEYRVNSALGERPLEK
ncbi:response regulator [Desulfacinum hydrothermale]|nr:response regulator [Desulfacinum hydrothermale]